MNMKWWRAAATFFLIGIAAGAAPHGTQVASPVNERAGLFSCACADGRNGGTIVVPSVMLAWQQYDALNAQISALSARVSTCLAQAASGKPGFGCSSLQSQETSLRARVAGILSLAQGGTGLAVAQCATKCNATRPAAPPAAAPLPDAGRIDNLPVGNAWSLGNTISGRNSIKGLSPIQQKWEEDKQRMLQAFKPIGAAIRIEAPKATAAEPAAKPGAPAAQPDADPLTGFKLLRAPDVPAGPPVTEPQTNDPGIDPELERAIADELTMPENADVRKAREEAARALAPHISANLSPELIAEMRRGLRAWELMPNAAVNPARQSLDSARKKALDELEVRARTTPPDPKRDLRPFFRNDQLFEHRVLPALKMLDAARRR